MISTGETMERVRVTPKALIETLKKNFERHKQEYKAACESYRNRATNLLKDALSRLEKGNEVVSLAFDLEPPDNHSKDYERAIAMLEMSQDETVTVTATQFAAFVQDDWSWKQQFNFKNSSYMAR